MTGAVLNTINTRLEADTIAYILDHGDAKAFIVDTQFSPSVKEALAKLKKEILVIDIVDPNANLQEGQATIKPDPQGSKSFFSDTYS